MISGVDNYTIVEAVKVALFWRVLIQSVYMIYMYMYCYTSIPIPQEEEKFRTNNPQVSTELPS